jgi:hypothetical protein
MMAVYSDNHAKRTNASYEQTAEPLIIKGGGAYSYHWASGG